MLSNFSINYFYFHYPSAKLLLNSNQQFLLSFSHTVYDASAFRPAK